MTAYGRIGVTAEVVADADQHPESKGTDVAGAAILLLFIEHLDVFDGDAEPSNSHVGFEVELGAEFLLHSVQMIVFSICGGAANHRCSDLTRSVVKL
jgi:hypothetical protein